jgi:hypothetical protein
MGEDEGKTRVTFRWDPDLVERIDAYAQRVREDMPGLTFTRTEAVRVLLEKALAAVESETGGRTKRRKT